MKLVIVILVLIGVLFIVIVAMGLGHDDNATTLKPPKWLKKYVGSESVQAADLLTDCLKGNTFFIPIRSTCRVRVLRSNARLRKMKLRLQNTHDQVSIRMEPDPDAENGIDANIKLDSKKPETDLSFVKGRNDPPFVATLELTCRRAASFQCALQLEPASDP